MSNARAFQAYTAAPQATCKRNAAGNGWVIEVPDSFEETRTTLTDKDGRPKATRTRRMYGCAMPGMPGGGAIPSGFQDPEAEGVNPIPILVRVQVMATETEPIIRPRKRDKDAGQASEGA